MHRFFGRIKIDRQCQIRTSRLIETLRFFSFVLVSNKPFACAVFGIHRVKVLPSDNVFSLSAAHFLCRNCPKISISIKNETVKIYPDLSCQSFTLSCQRLEFLCQRYDSFLSVSACFFCQIY